MPHCFFIRFTLVGLAMFPVMVLMGCSNQGAFAAVDYAQCQKLGFNPGTQYYDMCLSEVQQQRTTTLAQRQNRLLAVPKKAANSTIRLPVRLRSQTRR
jgi:hypothetical protein